MTIDVASLVSDNLDIWTTAVERKSGAGRGGGKRVAYIGINRLRALIMDLAVRGKLLAQDPNDEPTATILSRIKAKPSHVKPFEIPDSWTWVAVGSVGHSRLGKMLDKAKNKGIKRRYLRNANVRWFDFDLLDILEMPFEESELEEFRLKHGDILICEGGEPGRTAVWDEREEGMLFQKAIHRLRFDHGVFPHYFAYFMKASADNGALARYFTGSGIQHFTGRSLDRMLFPLPPLAEQKRIVGKVDELMALCDALETESAAAMAAHQTLVEALLATLTASTDAADLATNWSRLEDHFDTLFTTEASVDVLKQTVLELAVRGKLVPQVSTDEPAAVMLKAVKKSGSDRGAKQKTHSTIAAADQPFDLPNGWCWERFDNLIEPDFPIAYGVLVPGADQTNGIPFVRIADLSITDPAPLPEKSISADVDAQFPRTRLRGGEILMGVVGSIGKLGVAPASWAGANIARAICRIVPSPLLDRSYVLWLLQSDFMQNSFIGDTRTLAQPTLNIGLIRLAATPVPPAAEQKRIVAKVDELMALCDALKARIADAVVTQKHLADAITERAAA